MTNTEIQLYAVYKSPIARLEDVCEKYFGLGIKTASDYAVMNRLPIPAFRLVDSRKAPWMVKLADLAAHIDSVQLAAAELWERSHA